MRTFKTQPCVLYSVCVYVCVFVCVLCACECENGMGTCKIVPHHLILSLPSVFFCVCVCVSLEGSVLNLLPQIKRQETISNNQKY